MKKTILFFLIFINSLSAQVQTEWIRTFNGTGTGGNYADKGAVDKFGNFIIAGRSDSAGTGVDYIILKYSSSGDLLWSRRYDGIAHSSDRIRDLVLDDSGNVYVTGSSFEGSANGNTNFVTLKYSSYGMLKWQKSLDWKLHKEDVPFSIALDKQNNIYVVGYGWAPPIGIQNFDILLVKYNSDGVEQWTRSYNAQNYNPDWGYSVVADDSDNVYISGYSYTNEAIIITIKYDKDGNLIWVGEFPRNSSEYAIKLYSKIDKHNNIIVNGFYDNNTVDFVTLKYDREGNLLWNKVFNSPWNNLDFCNALYTDDNLNIYVTGRSFTNHWNDALIIKYAPNGDTLWVRYYDNGLDEHDELYSIIADSLGNVYATGWTTSTVTVADYLILKYGIDGNLIWTKVYNYPVTPPGQDIARVICLDRYNNIFISGSSYLSNLSYGIATIKYSQLTGNGFNTNILINDYSLKIYPNPFNPTTLISYNLSIKSFVVLKIYNVLGQEIKTLVASSQNPGNYNILFDGYNLPNGIYLCALYIDRSLKNIKKMVLAK